jgi:hypothetical protein
MKHLRWLAVFVVLWSGSAVKAEPVKTVQDLVSACQRGNINELYCLGMLNGTMGLMNLSGTASGVSKVMGMCTSEFVSNGQAQQVFLNWAKRNPKYWQREAYIGVFLAVRETWPCPK